MALTADTSVWAGHLAMLFVIIVLVLLWAEIRSLRQRLGDTIDDIESLQQRLDAMEERRSEEHRLSIEASYGVGQRLTRTEKKIREIADRQVQADNFQNAELSSRAAQRIRQRAGPSEPQTRNEAKLAALLRPDTDQD